VTHHPGLCVSSARRPARPEPPSGAALLCCIVRWLQTCKKCEQLTNCSRTFRAFCSVVAKRGKLSREKHGRNTNVALNLKYNISIAAQSSERLQWCLTRCEHKPRHFEPLQMGQLAHHVFGTRPCRPRCADVSAQRVALVAPGQARHRAGAGAPRGSSGSVPFLSRAALSPCVSGGCCEG